MSSLPHQINIGWLEVRIIRTQVLRFSGHVSGRPKTVCDQSKERIRWAISLLPGKMRSNSGPWLADAIGAFSQGYLYRTVIRQYSSNTSFASLLWRISAISRMTSFGNNSLGYITLTPLSPELPLALAGPEFQTYALPGVWTFRQLTHTAVPKSDQSGLPVALE